MIDPWLYADAVKRYRAVVAEQLREKRKRLTSGPPPVSTTERPTGRDVPEWWSRRSKHPKAVIMGEAFMVLNTIDIALARQLMTAELLWRGVDQSDIDLIIEEPVALTPWMVEPDRKRKLEGVLFR